MDRHSSGRRWSLVAAVSVVLAGCLVLGVWLGTPWWTGRPWDGKLTDRERRVSIVIPDGWVDVTHDEAGRVVTSDASGDEIDPYRLPDLAAISGESDTARFGSQEVRVDVLPTDGASLDRLHREHVTAMCPQNEHCPYRAGPAKRLLVDQHLAVSRLLTPPAVTEIVWVVTVLDGESVVRFTGTSNSWREAEDEGQLATVLNTLEVLT